jgi:hypothetical protein
MILTARWRGFPVAFEVCRKLKAKYLQGRRKRIAMLTQRRI